MGGKSHRTTPCDSGEGQRYLRDVFDLADKRAARLYRAFEGSFRSARSPGGPCDHRLEEYLIVHHGNRTLRFRCYDLAVSPNIERRMVSLRRFAGHFSGSPQRPPDALRKGFGLRFAIR